MGIDKQANPVVIELKRDDNGSHMELQALRYAAMVSTLTFQKAIAIYQDYLHRRGVDLEAETELLNFLGWESPLDEIFFANVKLVLAAADFSIELTTTVMWLNERDLDICCVRLQPYRLGNELLIDIQQVIPLPEAADYQVRVREQSDERKALVRNNRDTTKYEFNGETYNKRRLVHAVVKHYIEQHPGITLNILKRKFPDTLHGTFEVIAERTSAQQLYYDKQHKRHFLADSEILRLNSGQEIAVCNQWGIGNIGPFIKVAESLGYDISEVP